MEERRVAAIPHVNISGAMGVREYGIMLTDQRTIFALLKEVKMTGAILGGAIGHALATSMAKERHVDLENTSPEQLAAKPDSIIVPHDSVDSIRFKKSVGTYYVQIKYKDFRGKKKKLNVAIVPTSEYLKKRKEEGVKRKEVLEQYSANVENAYRKALPLTVALNTRWSE